MTTDVLYKSFELLQFIKSKELVNTFDINQYLKKIYADRKDWYNVKSVLLDHNLIKPIEELDSHFIATAKGKSIIINDELAQMYIQKEKWQNKAIKVAGWVGYGIRYTSFDCSFT